MANPMQCNIPVTNHKRVVTMNIIPNLPLLGSLVNTGCLEAYQLFAGGYSAGPLVSNYLVVLKCLKLEKHVSIYGRMIPKRLKVLGFGMG